MDTMAIEFLNNVSKGQQGTVSAKTRDQFIVSLRDIHDHGYYISSTKDGTWKASNQNHQKLQLQKEKFADLIAATFVRSE